MIEQSGYSNNIMALSKDKLDTTGTGSGAQKIVEPLKKGVGVIAKDSAGNILDDNASSTNLKKRRNTDTTMILNKPAYNKGGVDLKRPRCESLKETTSSKKPGTKNGTSESSIPGTIDIAFLLDDNATLKPQASGKLPYSYATLITYAILHHPQKKMTLSEIYTWLLDKFPHFKSSGSGWKNSIRHNLSLNKTFVRIPRPVNQPGKGAYWAVDLSVLSESIYLKSRNRRTNSESLSTVGMWPQSNKFHPGQLRQQMPPIHSMNMLYRPQGNHQKSKSDVSIIPYGEKNPSMLSNGSERANSLSDYSTKGMYSLQAGNGQLSFNHNNTTNQVQNLLPLNPNFGSNSQSLDQNLTSFQTQVNFGSLLPMQMDQHYPFNDGTISGSRFQDPLVFANSFQNSVSNSSASKKNDTLDLLNISQQSSNTNGSFFNSINDMSLLASNNLDFGKIDNLTDLEKYHILQASNVYLFEKGNEVYPKEIPSSFTQFKSDFIAGDPIKSSNSNIKESNSPYIIFYENKMSNYLPGSKNPSKTSKRSKNKTALINKGSATGKAAGNAEKADKNANRSTKVSGKSNTASQKPKIVKKSEAKEAESALEEASTNAVDSQKPLNLANALEAYCLEPLEDNKILNNELLNGSATNLVMNDDFLKSIGYLISESEFGTSNTEKSDSTVGKLESLNFNKNKDFSDLSNSVAANTFDNYLGLTPISNSVDGGDENFKNKTKDDVFLGSYVDNSQNKLDDIFNEIIGADPDWIGKIF